MSLSCVIRQARAGNNRAKAHGDAGTTDLNTRRADSTTCTWVRQVISLPESFNHGTLCRYTKSHAKQGGPVQDACQSESPAEASMQLEICAMLVDQHQQY